MPLINDAAKLYLGSQTITAAYMAGVIVWPKPVANTLAASLANAGDPNARVSTSYRGVTPATYKFYSSTNGAAYVLRLTTASPGPHVFGTTYSSTFKMKVESFDAAGNGLQTALTNTVNIGAAPPVYVQRVWSGVATAAASYNGSNQKRSDADGVASCYYGYYSSNQGQQKSLVIFGIPAEIRNCASVDRVELSWYNKHHFLNSGGRVSLVGHHGGSLPTSFPGSTGVLLSGGAQVKWPAPKPGQINGTTWFDVGDLNSSGRPTIKEEIRVQGMTGFGLVGAESGQNGYGYAATNPTLRITYTVRI